MRAHVAVSVAALVGACGRFGFDAGVDAGALDATDALPGSYPATVLADQPRTYHRLGERAGLVLRDAVGGADAQIMVNGGLLDLGRPGALTRDSDSAIRFAADGNIGPRESASAQPPDLWTNFGGDFTIEAYIRPITLPPGGDSHSIFVCEDYLTNGFRTGWDPGLVLEMWATEANSTGDLDATASMTLGTWHHVAFVRRDTTAEIFLDAVSVGITAFDYLPPTELADCGFGAFHGMPSDIELDEIAIYDRPLSQQTLETHVAAAGR